MEATTIILKSNLDGRTERWSLTEPESNQPVYQRRDGATKTLRELERRASNLYCGMIYMYYPNSPQLETKYQQGNVH